MNTRSRLPEQGWRAVGRHGGLLPLTVVPSHFSLVFVKPMRIPRDRHAASNISPLFDAARRARVGVSGRPSSRHHLHTTERKAGQRRRALLARRERSHAQDRPFFTGGTSMASTHPLTGLSTVIARSSSGSVGMAVLYKCGFFSCGPYST